MELYQLIATINNTAETFTFDFLPENFEGAKISQKFSFVNPIGYTPKFSLSTMRIIQGDKQVIDEVFLTYGLQSDVTIDIYKLNEAGTDYDLNSTFSIDFESYEMYDYYSEFALKSISTIDFYNNIKNTEMQVELTHDATLPMTQNYINYVSLKNFDYFFSGLIYFMFAENSTSKIYNKDLSLFETFKGDEPTKNMYIIGENSTPSTVKLIISGSLNLKISGINETVSLQIIKISGSTSTIIHTIFTGAIVSAGTIISNTINTTEFDAGVCIANDTLVLRLNTSNGSTVISGDIFIDLKRKTDINVINYNNNLIKYVPILSVISDIFNSNSNVVYDHLNSYGLTSSSQLDSLNGFATIKPKEFLSDLCLALGLMVNFKLDGSVTVDSINTIFNNLLNTSNAIEINNFKDLSKNYFSEINFASVTVGQEISDYDVYTYLIDWNKKLTFKQENRAASENLDLSLQKYRTDFSGMLDYYVKRSQQKTNVSKDNFLFDTAFSTVWIGSGFTIYDSFNPRYILNSWNKFLSFCFLNFGLDTLTISSNGGTVDNLKIGPIFQMDNFAVNSTPRLLPISYNFTCLIDDIDFSEKILKINDNGTDVYLFVFDAETTDKLTEQTIKGLKIQF